MNEKLLYLIPTSIVIAGLIVGGSIYLVNQNTNPLPAGTPQPTGPEFSNVNNPVAVDGDPVLGNNSAKVTIIEFSDFQCSFCKKFDQETMPKIKSKYIDTGKAKIIFKNFPIAQIHDKALISAEAGECAFEQNKFWEYSQKLFGSQSLDKDSLKKYAQDLNLDVTEFNSCLDSGKYAQEVKDDLAEGEKAGIRGTPSFIVNGTLIDGAYPFSVFESVIDKKLK